METDLDPGNCDQLKERLRKLRSTGVFLIFLESVVWLPCIRHVKSNEADRFSGLTDYFHFYDIKDHSTFIQMILRRSFETDTDNS